MYKILVAEDEPLLSASIKEILCDLGEITQVYQGDEALYEAESGLYDLLVLDIMLPELDGFQVLKTLKEQNSSLPVLVLTAKDQIENKITGFKAGADDYLTKPFHREELLLRAQALLKRSFGLQEIDTLKRGELVLHLKNRTACYQNQSLDFVGKEFDLLVYLLENQGMILTKEQIFNKIWEFDSETSVTVVEVYISKIRKELKKANIEDWIKTVRGVGYIVEVPDGE